MDLSIVLQLKLDKIFTNFDVCVHRGRFLHVRIRDDLTIVHFYRCISARLLWRRRSANAVIIATHTVQRSEQGIENNRTRKSESVEKNCRVTLKQMPCLNQCL